MAGPKAPKDPERKRPYFYIMKDKDIYGSVQEEMCIRDRYCVLPRHHTA